MQQPQLEPLACYPSPGWTKHWQGMPEFGQENLDPYQTVRVHFRCAEDRKVFAEMVGQKLTERTLSIWHPARGIDRYIDKAFVSEQPLHPKHPVYVISKGRSDRMLTVKSLTDMGVRHHLVVEPPEEQAYAEALGQLKAKLTTLLVLPFANLGKGSIPARNWVWDHALESKASSHWILDDNIGGFFRLFRNQRFPVRCPNIFRAAEQFVGRYINIGLAGFNYRFFGVASQVRPAYYFNTRIYSCILIRNDLPHRWRGRYNEDTDLSLRVLKDKWCTVLFNAFLVGKAATMTMRGGNTDELYKGDGRLAMAKSLRRQHPDVVSITRKWGRWQHQVNYDGFKRLRLKPKQSTDGFEGTDNFGMFLRDVGLPIVLVGQAPSKNGDASRPLEGKIGRRLAKLMGTTVERYLEITERMNLLDEWPGKQGKGDAWNSKAAEDKVRELREAIRGRRTVFLGSNVAKAFGESGKTSLELRYSERLQAETATIPHPSGIVKWWNDPKNVERASEFLRKIVQNLLNTSAQRK